MTALEKIALDKLREKLASIRDRCQDANEGRMDHERTFIRSDAKEAVEILLAILNHSSEK